MILFNRTLSSNPPCKYMKTGSLYSDRSGFHGQFDPKGSVFVNHKISMPENDTWVEVTHFHSVKRGKRYPESRYWTYVTPNSGIRMFTGTVVGFKTQKDAARAIGQKCRDKWCRSTMPRVFDTFVRRGYDSMFFTDSKTAHRCKTSHVVELVFLRVRESYASACVDDVPFRDYYFQPCECRERKDCITCHSNSFSDSETLLASEPSNDKPRSWVSLHADAFLKSMLSFRNSLFSSTTSNFQMTT